MQATTLFQNEITISSLSRDNRTKYENVKNGITKVTELLAGIGLDISEALVNQAKSNQDIKSIQLEDQVIKNTVLEIINEFGGDKAISQEEKVNSNKEYRFDTIYDTKFKDKITDGIQTDSLFRKAISLGVRKQYIIVKNKVRDTNDLYKQDSVGNTAFTYINAFTMEGVGHPIQFPVEGIEREKLLANERWDTIALVINITQFLHKYESEKIQSHYEKIKKAFMDNVVSIILNATNKQYMYESFVRTDLLRWHIKSVGDINNGFDQILLLANILHDTKMILLLHHLISASVAHKHTDDTNSGNFIEHVKVCESLLGKKILGEKIDRNIFNYKELEKIATQE